MEIRQVALRRLSSGGGQGSDLNSGGEDDPEGDGEGREYDQEPREGQGEEHERYRGEIVDEPGQALGHGAVLQGKRVVEVVPGYGPGGDERPQNRENGGQNREKRQHAAEDSKQDDSKGNDQAGCASDEVFRQSHGMRFERSSPGFNTREGNLIEDSGQV